MSKRKHQQHFKEEYNKLWPVLKASKISTNHAFCTIFSTDINIAHGGRDDCRRHLESGRHVVKAKVQSSHQSLRSLFIKPTDLVKCKYSSFDLCCYKQQFSENELVKARKATYLANHAV